MMAEKQPFFRRGVLTDVDIPAEENGETLPLIYIAVVDSMLRELLNLI